MTEERVYTVVGPTAEPATPITLADAGLKERRDLQEWVMAHPEILGPGIMVVTSEFDRWQAAAGGRPLDRLDVLGLDSDGRLVVAELKRDRAPDTVEMQAIKYAAFVSRFTEEALAEHHLAHLRRSAGTETATLEAAREALLSHAGGELDAEILRQPRIVLVAGAFPAAVTAAAVWLNEMGVQVSLQRVQAYRVGGDQIIVSVTQLYPIADAEEFTVGPIHGEATTRIRRKRERSAVVRVVDAGEIDDGVLLELRAPADMPPDDRSAIDEWIAGASATRGRFVWRNDRAHPIEWGENGLAYRPTPLVREVLALAGLDDRVPSGSSWFTLPDGRTLAQVAATVAGGFDWASLHAILAHLPEGRWTTYGDLAEAVGTGAMALGQHIAACAQCENAWRVLGADGRPRSGFAWAGPTRVDSQADQLAAEGVAFEGGRASGTQRLDAGELAELVKAPQQGADAQS